MQNNIIYFKRQVLFFFIFCDQGTFNRPLAVYKYRVEGEGKKWLIDWCIVFFYLHISINGLGWNLVTIFSFPFLESLRGMKHICESHTVFAPKSNLWKLWNKEPSMFVLKKNRIILHGPTLMLGNTSALPQKRASVTDFFLTNEF